MRAPLNNREMRNTLSQMSRDYVIRSRYGYDDASSVPFMGGSRVKREPESLEERSNSQLRYLHEMKEATIRQQRANSVCSGGQDESMQSRMSYLSAFSESVSGETSRSVPEDEGRDILAGFTCLVENLPRAQSTLVRSFRMPFVSIYWLETELDKLKTIERM